jgi:hypothetical protein
VVDQPAAEGGIMNLDQLTQKVKGLFGSRSTDDMKQDAMEVKETATSDASVTDKAKKGYEDVKDPGAPGPG